MLIFKAMSHTALTVLNSKTYTDAKEIKRVWCTLNTKKIGLRNISTSLLQAMIDLISEPLAYIFNLSFLTGVLSTDFKVTN